MYYPIINEKKCKQLGECFRICPEDVFDMKSGIVTVERPGDCTGCEACIAVCPKEAVSVEIL